MKASELIAWARHIVAVNERAYVEPMTLKIAAGVLDVVPGMVVVYEAARALIHARKHLSRDEVDDRLGELWEAVDAARSKP